MQSDCLVDEIEAQEASKRFPEIQNDDVKILVKLQHRPKEVKNRLAVASAQYLESCDALVSPFLKENKWHHKSMRSPQCEKFTLRDSIQNTTHESIDSSLLKDSFQS